MKLLLNIALLLLCSVIVAQENPLINEDFSKNGECYIAFELDDPATIAEVSKLISIDSRSENKFIANVSEKELNGFKILNIPYTYLAHPNEDFEPLMKTIDEIQHTRDWNFYPSYESYVDMMYQFEADFPEICDVFSIGQSVEGRELLVAKISDNPGEDENEPEFLYTSSMHGDELTGYILMLRLIDTLLTSYQNSPRINNLINNIEIHINPLANPDGAYHAGNHTVSGAIRRNANQVDLNRNFPDVITGLYPNTQPEIYAFMNYAEDHHFVLSSNIHGGVEVCNYPWDHKHALCADDEWWQFVCHEYADTAQFYSPYGYMQGFDDGITNGADWYVIDGGRQDYMNYFHQCREFTLEISSIKLPNASYLPTYWNYNYRSFLNYLEQSLYGLRGKVTDAVTTSPVSAEVFVLNHDIEGDSSWVYSNDESGNYYRYLLSGNYDIRFSAPGYIEQIFHNVNIQNYSTTLLDVQLEPDLAEITLSLKVVLEGPFNYPEMHNQLNPILPESQPFNTSPWFYPGNESISDFPTSAVDWILIELKEARNAHEAFSSPGIGMKACVLDQNSWVLDPVSFNHDLTITIGSLSQSLYVMIYHRNHIKVLSAYALTENSGIYFYDFTTEASQAYQANQKELFDGVYGMYSADANADGEINMLDLQQSWNTQAGLRDYLNGDFNQDQQIDNKDKNDYWLPNSIVRKEIKTD